MHDGSGWRWYIVHINPAGTTTGCYLPNVEVGTGTRVEWVCERDRTWSGGRGQWRDLELKLKRYRFRQWCRHPKPQYLQTRCLSSSSQSLQYDGNRADRVAGSSRRWRRTSDAWIIRYVNSPSAAGTNLMAWNVKKIGSVTLLQRDLFNMYLVFCSFILPYICHWFWVVLINFEKSAFCTHVIYS